MGYQVFKGGIQKQKYSRGILEIIQFILRFMLRKALGPQALPYLPEQFDEGWNEMPIGPDYAGPIAKQYFNMRKISIYGGSNEIQKNIVAKASFGL